MAVLDDLSGFEFEDLMEDVFRSLGYEDIFQAEKIVDGEGTSLWRRLSTARGVRSSNWRPVTKSQSKPQNCL